MPRPGSLTSRLSENPTVLVVEDEADIAEFLGAFFRASGLDVAHVDPECPSQVGDAVAAHRPDCVLLDYHLQGFSGLDVYRHLRSDPANAHLPVIMVTADSRVSTQHRAIEAGMDAFVTKPFNVKHLFELVEDRIARAGIRAGASDDVTSVASFGYLEDRLATEVTLAGHTDRPLALALIRLLSLRDTNRRLGLATGDYVLREMANRLLRLFPAPAVVGRSAGDEFAIVLPGRDADGAQAALEGALDALAAPVMLPGSGETSITVAAGVAAFPAHADDGDSLYMAADAALAEAFDRKSSVLVAR